MTGFGNSAKLGGSGGGKRDLRPPSPRSDVSSDQDAPLPPDIFVYDDLPPEVRAAVREFPRDLNCADLLPALDDHKVPPERLASAINEAAKNPAIYENMRPSRSTGRVGGEN